MDLRQRIAAIFDQAIFDEMAPELRTIRTATVRPFVEGKLELEVKKDPGERHYTYGGYGEQAVFTALEKILAGDWIFTRGKKLYQAIHFENSLLDFLSKQSDLSEIEIPENIFRQSYRPGQKQPFAKSHFLTFGDDHAEFLCRRFLDVCADRPHDNMDLGDRHNSGLIAFIVLDTFHANGENHGKITVSDLFENGINPIEKIGINGQTWPIQRICLRNKPRLSHKSIGGSVRDRYSSDVKDKSEQSIQLLQERVLNDFLDLSVNIIYPCVSGLNDIFESRFSSGSLSRTVLDVEKGVIFANQAAHGRFWLFGFCPIEGKKHKADNVMIKKIIRYFEKVSPS